MEFVHAPVMLAEVLVALRPKPGGVYADGTLGGGGHATAILEASAPSGWLWGCDRDEVALEAAGLKLARFVGRFELRRVNYAEWGGWIAAGSVDGALLDLGVSSPQLDVAERGFSFQREGPLDMRMDARQPLDAALLVNEWPETELARIFWELGGERQSRRIAKAIAEARAARRIETTTQLAGLIEKVIPRYGQKAHPATQVFQALRMTVNDELGALRQGLAGAMTILRSGGRLAVITFHSLEDRMVKRFGNERSLDYTFDGAVDVPELRRPRTPELRWVQRKAIQPSTAEVAANPRARSAQLRVMEKI